MSNFPIFGAGGRLEGDLGQQTSAGPALPHETKLRPTMEYRDVARDTQELDARFHAAALVAQPELTAAVDARVRASAIVEQRTQICLAHQAEVTRLQALVQRGLASLESEDDQAGSRAERLRSATAQLRESHAQLQAAKAELAAAKQKVDLLTVTL